MAINEKGGTNTSSPAPIFAAARHTCKAAVPDEIAMACFTPKYSAKAFSNSSISVPLIKVSFFFFNTFLTASISSRPTFLSIGKGSVCSIFLGIRIPPRLQKKLPD